jgi:poly(A) polymerase
MKQVL